jgi:hypothetical protein
MTETKLFRAALLLALVVFGTLHFLHFPGSVPYFQHVSGGGRLFDVELAHTPDEIHQRLEAFGEGGRSEYVFRNKTTDVLLPLSLLPLLVLGMARLRKRFRLGWLGRGLSVLPYLYVAFDFAENFTVISLIQAHPGQRLTLATVLPILTMIKRSAIMGSLLSLVIGLILSQASALWRQRSSGGAARRPSP